MFHLLTYYESQKIDTTQQKKETISRTKTKTNHDIRNGRSYRFVVLFIVHRYCIFTRQYLDFIKLTRGIDGTYLNIDTMMCSYIRIGTYNKNKYQLEYTIHYILFSKMSGLVYRDAYIFFSKIYECSFYFNQNR